MTDHLANAIRCYLERADITAVTLEQMAGIPGAALSSIFRGSHPTPKRMAAIYHAVHASDRAEANQLLIAYLLDDCPDDLEQRLRISIDDTVLTEPRHISADELERALAAYARAAKGDASLRAWLIDTANLLRLHDEQPTP